jgi:hypothetical protein
MAISARLKLDENILFLDGHYIVFIPICAPPGSNFIEWLTRE